MILESNKKRFSKVLFKKIFDHKNNNKKLKLTVAIPTYKRPELILNSLNLLSDNAKLFA